MSSFNRIVENLSGAIMIATGSIIFLRAPTITVVAGKSDGKDLGMVGAEHHEVHRSFGIGVLVKDVAEFHVPTGPFRTNNGEVRKPGGEEFKESLGQVVALLTSILVLP